MNGCKNTKSIYVVEEKVERATPITAERIFKASHRIAKVADYRRKGWIANFGC